MTIGEIDGILGRVMRHNCAGIDGCEGCHEDYNVVVEYVAAGIVKDADAWEWYRELREKYEELSFGLDVKLAVRRLNGEETDEQDDD